MSRWPAWVTRALTSPVDPSELDPSLEPEALELVRTTVSSTDEEVDAFLRRADHRRAPRVDVARVAFIGAGAVVAAAVVAAVVQQSPVSLDVPAERPFPAVTSTPLTLTTSEPLQFGPSIEASGLAALSVARSDEAGTWLVLDRGSARFSVDPDGPRRHLVVRAHDVEVEVKGTIFDVHVVEDRVHVAVVRGRVEVRHDGVPRALRAGEAWTRPAPVADVAQLEPPPSTPPDAAVVALTPLPKPPSAPQHLAVRVGQEVDASSEAPPALKTAEAFNRILDLMVNGTPTAEVVAQLEDFIAAHPAGPLTEEAEFKLIKLNASLRSSAQRVADIEAFLERWPTSPHRIELRYTQGRLLSMELDSCARALPMLAEVSSSDQPNAPEALGLHALCLHAMGDPGAEEALRKALTTPLPESIRNDVSTALLALPE